MKNIARIVFSQPCWSPASAPAPRRTSSRRRRSKKRRSRRRRSATETTGKYTRESLDTDSCLRQRVVYFDLDQTEIKPEFQAQIACHAAYLRQFPEARVRLEGNADERGSREYNLGLGERRGNAVQSALSGAGASSSQLNVVSYGEERPVCRQHDESCWSKNRRVEIIYTAK